MIPVRSGGRVWLAVGHTDMRRGMNSLALQVQEKLGRDPHAGDLYVFRGKRGHLIKILWHDGIGMSLYAKRLERGRFIWPAPADGTVAITQARSWPICLTALTGETRFIPGGRKQPGKTCGRLTHPEVGRRPGLCGSATIGPVTTPDNPPDELDALKAALRVEREARQQAEARASSAEAMVAYYKLQIAKLRREQYGQSSERGRKLLDQLELQLEEAAASAAEDEIRAAPFGSTMVGPFNWKAAWKSDPAFGVISVE